jgi:fumarylacetoacetate (FAA) hydrolase
MRVATLRRGGRDGTLAVVHPAGDRAVMEPGGFPTLQAALDDWPAAASPLEDAYERLVADTGFGQPVEWSDFHSPLPRAYHWCETSSYLAHMERARAARRMEMPPNYLTDPIVYQAGSCVMLAPLEPIPLPDLSWGLDLEATLAVITDDVPVGTRAHDAPQYVRFLVLLNDLTYRNVIASEFAKSIGPYLAKPARAYAPIAVSPTSLGDLWDGRILRATVKAWINDVPLGSLPAEQDYAFDFADTIEYVTRTRPLGAGSLVGLGTVSSRNPDNGFGCIFEKRAVEIISDGEPRTPFLTYGDIVRIEAFAPDGTSLFGSITQTVVPPADHGSA